MTRGKPVQVMIVDDHPVVHSGLVTFLSAYDDLELVEKACNGEEAIRLCEQLQPDVVLMDLVMPGMDGTTAIRIIRERWPQVQIIALTSFQDEKLVCAALQAGAISYLLKNVPPDELANSIRKAHIGQPTLAPEATHVLITSIRNPPNLGYDLTKRELEVLALMVEGLSNRQIAERLVITISTVKFHISNILSKLQVSNRAGAIALALRDHLVT